MHEKKVYIIYFSEFGAILDDSSDIGCFFILAISQCISAGILSFDSYFVLRVTSMLLPLIHFLSSVVFQMNGGNRSSMSSILFSTSILSRFWFSKVLHRLSCCVMWCNFEKCSAYEAYVFCFSVNELNTLVISKSTCGNQIGWNGLSGRNQVEKLQRCFTSFNFPEICDWSVATRPAEAFKWSCIRLHIFFIWSGCRRSNTSGSRLAGNETVPRITGKNCGIFCKWKMKVKVTIERWNKLSGKCVATAAITIIPIHRMHAVTTAFAGMK